MVDVLRFSGGDAALIGLIERPSRALLVGEFRVQAAGNVLPKSFDQALAEQAIAEVQGLARDDIDQRGIGQRTAQICRVNLRTLRPASRASRRRPGLVQLFDEFFGDHDAMQRAVPHAGTPRGRQDGLFRTKAGTC